MNRRRAKYFIAALLWLCLALWFWHAMLGNPLTDLALLRHGQIAKGEIIDADEDVGDGDEGQAIWSHTASYVYTLPDGRQFQGKYSGSGRLKRDLTLPLSVEVEYLSTSPQVSRIKGTGSQTAFQWIIRTVLSLVFLTLLGSPSIHLLKKTY
jgi:hypothetical protein